jgi:uncharacterized OB-fold protein
MDRGVVYTETVVFSPPSLYVNDAPYQLAIVDLAAGKKLTVRIEGQRVGIGDEVVFVEERDGVNWFRRA